MDLQEIDFSDLEFEEIGVWPIPLRIGCVVIACALAIGGSYFFIVKKQTSGLVKQQKKQKKLRKEFKEKYNKAANLEAYQNQMTEMKRTYRTLLRQLSSEGQVPSLIEDISQQASTNGLEYKLIKPGQEKSLGFYMELPINLSMEGSYHGFGGFVSGISKLPRIVTLHDFTIKRVVNKAKKEGDTTKSKLVMDVKAKTYWLSQEEL